MLIFLFFFMAAWLMSLSLTPLMRLMAIRFNIIDAPTTDVKTHTKPTPYMGGLAMLLATLVTIIIGGWWLDLFDRQLLAILGGMFFLSGMGFIDDVFNLKPITRFIGQILVAILLILVDVRLQIMYLPDWLNIALTIFWIVGITNALNIIDIMDGLASGVAVIAGATFFFVAIPTEQMSILLISSVLVGAALGFLYHNFFPARIYMGDSGAYLLGFTLAVIAIQESFTSVNTFALLSPILILGIPIYDTFFVMFLRIIQGRNPFHGSRDHFALRLEKLGIPRKFVVIQIYHIAVILGMAAFIATQVELWGALFIYSLIILIALAASRQLWKYADMN